MQRESQMLSCFSLLKMYMKREGHCHVPSNYKEGGVILGSWVRRQRQAKKKGRLSTDKARRLDGLGIIWNPIEAQWEARLALRCIVCSNQLYCFPLAKAGNVDASGKTIFLKVLPS
jgi:hypothetical protein